MTLYQPEYRDAAAQVDPALKSLIVHAFLEEVQAYAGEMILKKEAALSSSEGLEPDNTKKEIAKKLRQWRDYRDFNRIALQEIEDGTLDDWFKRLLK